MTQQWETRQLATLMAVTDGKGWTPVYTEAEDLLSEVGEKMTVILFSKINLLKH